MNIFSYMVIFFIPPYPYLFVHFPLFLFSLGVLHEWPKPSSLVQKRRFDVGKDYFWTRSRLGPLGLPPPIVSPSFFFFGAFQKFSFSSESEGLTTRGQWGHVNSG